MVPLAEWLQSLGSGRYAEVFERNDVDLAALPTLSDADLQLLGLSLGHRRKLLGAIAELSGTGADPPAAAASPAQEPARTEGERRQLTVLFRDMVGFTALASRLDPEVLQGVVRSYEDACAACVTRYGGCVFQRLGDGIVAFFGYP
jgi:class 3 adenylate cyclase